MESRLRMLLVLAGFPEPEVNVILRDLRGDWSRRFDLCYLALRLIIEYDGEQHGDLDHHRDSDIHRREELERLGYPPVQVTSRGLYGDPARTLRRVADALRQVGGYVPWSLAARVAAALSRAAVDEGGARLNRIRQWDQRLDGRRTLVGRNPPPSQERTTPECARPPEPTAESRTNDTRLDGPPPKRTRTPDTGPGRSCRKHAGRATAAGSGCSPTAAVMRRVRSRSQKPDSSRRRRQRSSILSMKVPSDDEPWGPGVGRRRVCGAIVPTCCQE